MSHRVYLTSWFTAACLLALWVGMECSPVLAEAGPTTSSFEIDADDGAWIDATTGDVYDDGLGTRAKFSVSGKMWRQTSEQAYMGRYSYEVEMTGSNLPPGGNERSEQKVLSGWSLGDDSRYFSGAFYVPQESSVPHDQWTIISQLWQDETCQPPVSVGFGADPYGTDKTAHLLFSVRGEAGRTLVHDGGPIARDRWYRFLLRVRTGFGGTGSITVWLMDNATGLWFLAADRPNLSIGFEFKRDENGQPTTVLADTNNFTWKVGQYRQARPDSTILLQDNIMYVGNNWNWVTKSRTVGYHRALVDLWFDDAGSFLTGPFVQDHSAGWNNGWDLNNDGKLFGAYRTAGGVVGSCLMFDGIDDYASVPVDSEEFDVGNYLSFSAWFKTSTSQAAKGLVTMDEYSTTYKGRLYWVSDTQLSFTVRHPDGSLSTVSKTFAQPLNDNAWHHIVGTYNRWSADGTRQKMYVDGALVASSAGTDRPVLRADNFLYVGRFSGNYFKGLMDEVMLFNYELSASEVAWMRACYQSGRCW